MLHGSREICFLGTFKLGSLYIIFDFEGIRSKAILG